MNRYKKSRLFILVSIVSVLSFSLLFLTTKSNMEIPLVSSSARNIVSVANDMLSAPVRFLSERKVFFQDLIDAYSENQELKKTLSTLKNEAAENETLKKENEGLKASLNLASASDGQEMIGALVSVRTPVSWLNKMIVNKGSNQGVKSNMLVVANGGIVGLVTDVGESSSSVQLFTSSADFTKVAVRISVENESIYGILSGYDIENKAFIISQLNSSADIAVGSQVVTSDLAGDMASNLLVGQVKSVKTSSNNLSRELYVTPVADFSAIYSVMLVGGSNE
ncbi:rod shape-determining protein MreC [Streptococcus gallolyticus]|uniref:rod shape-determining protein MreC n=1 Tax=Streptococcus hepaticus TaxID=3349163 RepID=UPI001C97EA2C|nr:rod shape-determining protein MreC [Streptococcus gallolyticus]MBY5041640.1 rod shape-determining protein MreC [Streptococcus gallolyticus]